MPDVPTKSVKPIMTARDKAELMLKMTKEAERAGRRCGAEAAILICVFREGDQLTIQDAGKFVMPPPHLYNVMIQAHENGQLGSPKKSKILRTH